MFTTFLHQPNRRNLLRLLTAPPLFAALEPLAFAADFWVKKKPAEWSSDEVEHMKSKSPWAKKTHAELTGMGGRGGGRGGRGMGGAGGDMGGGGNDMSADSGGGGGRGGGRGGGGRGGDLAPAAPSAPQGPELIIRWETAAPVLAATHMEMPETFGALYGISVTGIPPQMIAMALSAGGRGRGRGGPAGVGAPQPDAPPPVDPAVRQKEMVARLLRSVSLTAKGRDPQSAVIVQQTKASQALIFGFEKASFPLTAADREVVFQIKLTVLTAKARFEPREMIFEGKLAV